jgi:hypothetical protein
MQLPFFVVRALFVDFGVPVIARVNDIGQQVQLLSQNADGRQLTQNPTGVAELIYMQGAPTWDSVNLKIGNSIARSGIPWGTPQCIGTFNATLPTEVEVPGRTIPPLVPDPSVATTGNFVLTSDPYSLTQTQLKMVRISYSGISTYLNQGRFVIMFINLVWGKSFDVFVGNSNSRVANSVSNLQSSSDILTVQYVPSAIANAVQDETIKGFSLRDANSQAISPSYAITPLSATEFATAGAVTLIFIVGDSGNLTRFPYTIVAMDLNCSKVSSGNTPVSPTDASLTAAPVLSMLCFIICSCIFSL